MRQLYEGIYKEGCEVFDAEETERLSIGNLRHTFATRMQEAGTSPVTLAQMMGHSSTGIIQTYAKVLDEYRRDAVKKLERYRRSKVADIPAPEVTNSQVN